LKRHYLRALYDITWHFMTQVPELAFLS
jgi:hypothetical protein